MSEWNLIGQIRETLEPHPRLLLGPGDDAALIALTAGRSAVLTTDMLMDGVHFQLAQTEPERIGYKALAVSLSDAAAMASHPVACVVALALPRRGGIELGRRILSGIHRLAQDFDVAIAGGDTNSWDGPLVVSLTLLGETTPFVTPRRSDAQAGDSILVTGALGGSIFGRHLDFVPRVKESLILAERYPIQALMDLSDGLASDVRRLGEESGLGAVIFASQVPIHDDVSLHNDGRPAFEHAMCDGEDFELCFTMGEPAAKALLAEQPLSPLRITQVGVMQQSREFVLETAAGVRQPLTLGGFVHPLD